MGTRGLTVVKSKGKVKVAQYGQWDHYPSGQGKTIARFIQNEMDLNKFKTRVDKLQFATPKQVDATWVDCGAAPGADFISFSIADDHAVIYPEFSRDTGAEILGLIQDAGIECVENSLNFLKDGLFCEYAYMLDLDKKVVTVYVSGEVYAKIPFAKFTEAAMDELETKLKN
jgi:hypothetical protein